MSIGPQHVKADRTHGGSTQDVAFVFIVLAKVISIGTKGLEADIYIIPLPHGHVLNSFAFCLGEKLVFILTCFSEMCIFALQTRANRRSVVTSCT